MTRSESILGRFEVIDENTQWPETLELPKAYRDGFKQLAQKTRETGLEQSACLSLVAESQGGTDPTAALQEYQALLGKKKQMAADEFERESSRLRNLIEGSASATNTATTSAAKSPARIWQLGATQGGNQTSVKTEENLGTCESISLGKVHTHPHSNSRGILSDTDIVNVIFWSEGQYSAVINNTNDVCIVIPPAHPINKYTLLGVNQFSAYDYGHLELAAVTFSNTIDSNLAISDNLNAVIPENKKVVGIPFAMSIEAYYAQLHGARLYCGQVDTPLTLAKPINNPANLKNNPGLVLASKAAMIMAKQFYHPEFPEIDFPFTPILDTRFLSYLSTAHKKLNPKVDTEAVLISEKENHAVLLSNVLLMLQNEQYPFEIGNDFSAFLVPDTRSNAEMRKLGVSYVYSLQPRSKQAIIFQQNSTELLVKVEDSIRIAAWEVGYMFYIANPKTNMIQFDYGDSGTYVGEGKYVKEKGWIPHGQGESDNVNMKIIGRFENGKAMDGFKYLDKKTGVWAVGKLK